MSAVHELNATHHSVREAPHAIAGPVRACFVRLRAAATEVDKALRGELRFEEVAPREEFAADVELAGLAVRYNLPLFVPDRTKGSF